MSRKVIVNGESICYLPPVDASEIRYDIGGGNYSNVQTELEGKVSKSGDTINGNAIIDTPNTTTTEAFSQLTLGNNIAVGTEGNSTGLIRTYARTGYCVEMRARGDLSADQHLYIPNKSGDIAIAQEYKRQANVTPSNDYPTLLSYINNYVYPVIGNQVYSFPCSGFPDLPVTNWGFDVTVHIAGTIFVTIHKQLSNNEDYIREIGSNSQWMTDWKRMAIVDDIYYHPGDVFSTTWLQWPCFINNGATAADCYMTLPKAFGSDVTNATITIGNISNLRVNGTNYNSGMSLGGGGVNSNSGIISFFINGNFGNNAMCTGQVALNNFTVTFI